jgi:hypothetical protein
MYSLLFRGWSMYIIWPARFALRSDINVQLTKSAALMIFQTAVLPSRIANIYNAYAITRRLCTGLKGFP